jgi:hypothetical protein
MVGPGDPSGSIILDPFQNVLHTENTALKPMLWIRTGFNADPDMDPDPAFFVNADPDPDPGS